MNFISIASTPGDLCNCMIIQLLPFGNVFRMFFNFDLISFEFMLAPVTFITCGSLRTAHIRNLRSLPSSGEIA